MNFTHLRIKQSSNLNGTLSLFGAKNATLVIMAATILTLGKTKLSNVPFSQDVYYMITLLQELGASIEINFKKNELEIDTSFLSRYYVSPKIMQTMRASILVMGPLLGRFGKTDIALPGGCSIGSRPIDYHLKNFERMGVSLQSQADTIKARTKKLSAQTFILDYPSVGATENIMMAATLTEGTTRIVNAALEPEVCDLMSFLCQMGANITITPPATITITGVKQLEPTQYMIMPDRLEAGSLLLAAAVTQGSINILNAQPNVLEIFLFKLQEMGHTVIYNRNKPGIRFIANEAPHAVSFKTGPYPGFPTDLQAPMMVAQCLAQGPSIIEETVFENRFLHIHELQKMGANIKIQNNKALLSGSDSLLGCSIDASDIRAACALALAGFAAQGTTHISGINHWMRGYQSLEKKLKTLGANIELISNQHEFVHEKPSQLTK